MQVSAWVGLRARSRRHTTRGFTLIELMTVVVVVGILSMIGLVSYRKLNNSAHTAEATQMIGNIRAAQEKYHSEVGSYYNLSIGLGLGASSSSRAALYPHQGRDPGDYKMSWGAACTAGACYAGKSWDTLGVQPDGPVYFGYSTVASTGSANALTVVINGTTLSWPSTTDWYMVSAVGDADGNGKFCTVIGTSYDGEIRVDMEGE